jgi:hypothetical protein
MAVSLCQQTEEGGEKGICDEKGNCVCLSNYTAVYMNQPPHQ